MSPSALGRHLIALSKYGYIQTIAGTKTKGYEYEIIQKQEYDDLKKSIGNALDQALGQLKIKLGNKENTV